METPLAVGPELDSAGLSELRDALADRPGLEIVPLWLRGRAIGVMLTLGRPRRPLAEIARQAAAAITLADRYTDTFARGQRRKRPRAAAEIQQSLLPPRITRIGGGEVAGNVLPSYDVAGDWFDVVENLDGVWITLADGLGPSTRAAASSAVALGALRASRRSGGTTHDALFLMHRTLREMPGPKAEMTALAARWDPATFRAEVVNCGHVAPLVIRRSGQVEHIPVPARRGLGGRASPRPSEHGFTVESGDRLLLYSDGVIADRKGQAGLGHDGVVAAALSSDAGSAADTVRKVHHAVLRACGSRLEDDATVVCLAVE
jgi:serine phosphatase RsbU (regulator of sigma subunit)